MNRQDRQPNDAQATIGPPRYLLTVREAAAALAISERKLWELTNCGTIQAVRIGRAVRYPCTVLQEFVAAQLT